MKKLVLLFHTLKYLKLSQIFYQFYYRLRKPQLQSTGQLTLRGSVKSWSGHYYLEPMTNDARIFTFLGQTAQLKGDWNDDLLPKLWLYNLHYHDYLNAKHEGDCVDLCSKIIDEWIEGNPPLHGNGWEPYCLSLRIVNWVKYFLRLPTDRIKKEWLASLAQQGKALEQQLEYHILANHLFANAKALVFIGSFLGGKQGELWLNMGLNLLEREIKEQFLDDGGHFERSTMYQAILLWDLADLLTLERTSELPELIKHKRVWEKVFSQGMEWLDSMCHPDGEIAFFNDATLGIAPTLKDLNRYSSILGISTHNSEVKPYDIDGKLLKSSGYGVIQWNEGHCLLADVAHIGPDYQPGHAHADTLSCEFSFYGHRVLVNSGISQYGDGEERHRQRSTKAHNTVVVDDENSTEVWSGFRVGQRAKPFGVSFEKQGGVIQLQGSHDGYKNFRKGVIHKRMWLAKSSSLTIEDNIAGRFETAVALWHLHPEVILKENSSRCFSLITTNGERLSLSFDGAKAVKVTKGTWHPSFGESVTNKVIQVSIDGSTLTTRLEF